VLERPLPDPAREALAVVLLHQLEQLRLLAGVDLLARAPLHRHPPGVGLDAPLVAGAAARAPTADDDVPELSGGAAAEPGVPVENEAATNAGSPPDADHALELRPCAEVELAVDGDLDVVADPHRRPELLRQVLAERERALPSRQVAGARDGAGRLVRVSGRADADPRELGGLELRVAGRLAKGGDHLGRDVLRPARGRRLALRLAEHLVPGVDDHRLDLRPAEVDAAAGAHGSIL
jgi:hypothetical protein